MTRADKGITSSGTLGALWPYPDPVPEEIVITEGEFDCIVLRRSAKVGGQVYSGDFARPLPDAYSLGGSASNLPTEDQWEELRDLGLKSVLVCMDMDRAGRKARELLLEAIRGAGIQALAVKPLGVNLVAGEKDARDVALGEGRGYPVHLVTLYDEDEPQPLSEVPLASTSGEPLVTFLHPREHTILYGDGGTGKGVFAAWLTVELLKEGKRVLVVDYEQHAGAEWRPRVEAFIHGSHMPSSKVQDVLITQPQKPIWEMQDALRDMASRLRVDYVIVDSVSYAVAGMDPETSACATKYSLAAAVIAKPMLSLAHVTKTNDQRYPFGSVFWHNGARHTIRMRISDPDIDDSHRIVECTKSNQGYGFRPQRIDWSWLHQRPDPPDTLIISEHVASEQEFYESFVPMNGREPDDNDFTAAGFRSNAKRNMGEMRRRAAKKGIMAVKRVRQP